MSSSLSSVFKYAPSLFAPGNSTLGILITNERFLGWVFSPAIPPSREETCCAQPGTPNRCASPRLLNQRSAERKGCFLTLNVLIIGSESPVSAFWAGTMGTSCTNALDSLAPQSISQVSSGLLPIPRAWRSRDCRRAGERNFRGVCCWRLGSRNRWESWSAYATRRGGLRRRPGPRLLPRAPRGHTRAAT